MHRPCLHRTVTVLLPRLLLLALSLAGWISPAMAALPPGVIAQLDIAYGPSPRQRLDVYRPTASTGPAPIIFMVHGGAWKIGDKSLANTVENKMARWVPQGFVFVSINYPMLPAADPLEQADYVAQALAFVQTNAASYGGDPARVVLMGHSAGAHLVSLIAAHPTLAAQQGVTPWLGTVSLDSGAYDVTTIMEQPHHVLYDEPFGTDPAFWRACSPSSVLTQPVPPILAIASSQRTDSTQQANQFAAVAKAIGSPVTVLLEDMTHEEINNQLGVPGTYTDSVEMFLRTLDPVIAARLGPGAFTAPSPAVYAGEITVSAGTLLVTGPLTGDVHVLTGGTLGGTGPIAGNLTIDAGGTLSPGGSPGRLTLNGTVTLSAGSTLQIEINGTNPAQYDALDVQGTVTAGGILNLVFGQGFTPGAGQNFGILSAPVLTGGFSQIQASGASVGFSAQLSSSTPGLYTLNVLPPPQPAFVAADFNADAKPDLIWSNSITGERALWLMNGTYFLGASTLGIFPLEWTVAATGDFNFDGKPDLVWSNSLTGERALWLMNGTQFIAASTLGVFPLEWTIAATGDFNADGKPDLVWSNSLTGERALWLMDGTQFIAASTLGVFPLEWTVAATGDFNDDYKPDLVWSNSLTGERALWLMDGTMFLGASTLGIFPLEWTVEGTGDFNFDGKPDLIWSNSLTGERALWLMNGTQFLAASTLGIFPLEWTVSN